MSAARFTSQLLAWNDRLSRNLPWRGDRDPYRIWISEVMLQQTRVETVKPYYSRWLQRFPSISHVARAAEDEILKAWEGLGYYRRARLFHQACKQIIRDHHGAVPDNPEAFRQLPGVGPYTYAAVRSICFHDPLPAVDGNLKRIMARILALSANGSALHRTVERTLATVIPVHRPGDFNQAMMDLGATVCTPRDPRCGECPISDSCQAHFSGQVDLYPRPTKRKPRPHVPVAVGIIWRDSQLLIRRRPPEGLLGGLWEFPGGKVEPGESPEQTVVREVQEELGLKVQIMDRIGTVRHAYSHFSITLHAFHCKYTDRGAIPQNGSDYRWISWDEISHFPFPKANHKLFPLIEGNAPPRDQQL
ncbi:MAG: A/G-specific adenine glycosylase [Fidelibacterota bacterium]|nr:MAG: A/G-specific adenine glycosylase [Candidatus Neomarinimicrobiota bacterium]